MCLQMDSSPTLAAGMIAANSPCPGELVHIILWEVSSEVAHWRPGPAARGKHAITVNSLVHYYSLQSSSTDEEAKASVTQEVTHKVQLESDLAHS